MKKEEEQLERLLQTKSINELTGEEQEFVLHMLGSLDEYEAIQKIESTLVIPSSSIKPNPMVLLSLKAQMKEKRLESSVWARIFDVKVPAYATVLLIVVGCSLTAWLRFPVTNRQPRTSVVSRIDTLIVTKIDTVIKERVVYRLAGNRISPAKQVFPAEPIIESLIPKTVGVSMKEKEELNKLLVSGSEQ